MKTTDHSIQVRDKVVDKSKAALDHKSITQTLDRAQFNPMSKNGKGTAKMSTKLCAKIHNQDN